MGSKGFRRKGESSGHDWWHIIRLGNAPQELSEQEEVDPFIYLMAAVLHDMADEKLHEDPQFYCLRRLLANWLKFAKKGTTWSL